MDGNDENSIDDFALDMLRRAKERNQAISGRLKHVEMEKTNHIAEIMDKIDKRSNDTSMKSPEKAPARGSPVKHARPILKPMSINEDKVYSDDTEGERPIKKCVTTFDADGTIVEAKTFMTDNEDESTDDEEMEMESEGGDNGEKSLEGEGDVNNLPKDEELDRNDNIDNNMEEGELGKTMKVNATPQLSRTLKKLAEFHSNKEIDSPVHPHTPLEELNSGKETNKGHISASRTARTSRLSALARTINEWEDDVTHHSIPGSRFSEVPNNSNPRASLSGKSRYSSASSPSACSPKSLGGKIGLEFQKSQTPPREISPVRSLAGSRNQSLSPAKSPTKSRFSGSPIKNGRQNDLAFQKSQTPPREISPVRSLADSQNQSLSPTKSPTKSRFSGSPIKNGGQISLDKLNPVSAIRMQFEGSGHGKVAPIKPERSRLKPYSAPNKTSNASRLPASTSTPVKKFYFGEDVKEKDPSSLSVAERAKLFEKSNFCPIPKKAVIVEIQSKKPNIFTSSPRVDNVGPSDDIDISFVTPVSSGPARNAKRPAPPPPVGAFTGCPPPPPPMPTTSTPTNVSSKRRSTSPTRTFPADSHAVKRIKVIAPKPGRIYPSLTDIETETETEAEGYGSEAESMDDSLESQQSLGTAIETIAKACSPIRSAHGAKIPARYRPSEDFSDTFACATVDALIDEALEGQDMTGTTINFSTTAIEADRTVCDAASLENTLVPAAAEFDLSANSANSQSSTSSPHVSVLENGSIPEGVSFSEADTTASSSFTSSPEAISKFSALSAVVNVEKLENTHNSHAAVEEPKQKNLPEIDQPKIDEEVFVPRQLVHTVSFYRRQQQQQKKADACSGLNDIIEHPESCEESEEEVSVPRPNPGDIIRKLEEEVEGRNLAIAQASKALSWCKALVGFSDSTEYIECERILLIETQRRMALLNSIHRIKTEGALSHQIPEVFSPSKQDVTPSCKGTMKISDISITLRREFFNAHRAECQYHFICLLKNKHHIEHTSLITYESQRQGSSIKFSNEFLMQSLDPDFQVSLQIYYLESAKEFLPHEAKYRINAKKDKQATLMLSPLLTPSKKSGKGDHTKSHISSPAGPDAVKSTSFKYCGGLSVDISSLQRTYWELDKASGPLSGAINIKVQCSAMGGVEHKGFLTLFEDVSGYGAWVRRWCRLGPTVLEFWKYPEDETESRKPPLGTLNLHECVTSRVRPAPRDVCARANTLLLVTTRAPHPNDKNTLVISCHKNYTAVRHLISADTREERDLWCQSLNRALANLRAWDPVAKQAVDDTLF